MLSMIALWFDLNYEKIWLVTMIIAITLFVIAIVTKSEFVYGVSEDVTDFYDEILSE